MKLTISQKGILKGVIKNGLDSGTLIDLIVRFDSAPDFFEKRDFGFPNTFYYHRISRREVVGVLINTYDYTKKDAVKELDDLTEKFGISIINRKDSDVNYENIVRDANKKAIKKNKNVKKIGTEDIIIIGGFLREKINFVHSTDFSFRETCKELEMNAFNITRD